MPRSTATSQPPRRREAEQRLPERLEVGEVALALLRHCVQIAEAALERIVREDRGRTGRVIGVVHHLARHLDRIAGHPAGIDALLLGEAFATAGVLVEAVVA